MFRLLLFLYSFLLVGFSGTKLELGADVTIIKKRSPASSYDNQVDFSMIEDDPELLEESFRNTSAKHPASLDDDGDELDSVEIYDERDYEIIEE